MWIGCLCAQSTNEAPDVAKRGLPAGGLLDDVIQSEDELAEQADDHAPLGSGAGVGEQREEVAEGEGL
eukprot:1732740-Pyramimonas_sp.AAC.1